MNAEGQGQPHLAPTGKSTSFPELVIDCFYMGERQTMGPPNIGPKGRASGRFAGDL